MPEPISNTTSKNTRPPEAPWPVLEVAQFLTISERHLRRLIDAGKVRTIRIGRRRLIPANEVARLANSGC